MRNFFKNRNCAQIKVFLVKNWIFAQRIINSVKNLNCAQIKICLVKNGIFAQRIICLLKNRNQNDGQKPKFWSKIVISSKIKILVNKNFCRKTFFDRKNLVNYQIIFCQYFGAINGWKSEHPISK